MHRPNCWSVLTRSPICGREEWSHLQINELGIGLGCGALPLDPQRRIEAGLCLWWTSGCLTKLRGEFGFHLRKAVNFKTSDLLKDTTLVSQIGLVASVQVGQPRVGPGPIGAPLWTKWAESKVAFSLASLWPNDRNGPHSLLSYSGFRIRKTEAKNTFLLAGIYEITAWAIQFWRYVCLCVSVYDRERERGELLKYFGGGKP